MDAPRIRTPSFRMLPESERPVFSGERERGNVHTVVTTRITNRKHFSANYVLQFATGQLPRWIPIELIGN